jgi:hypothetical protein
MEVQIKVRKERTRHINGPTNQPAEYYKNYYHLSGNGDRISCTVCGRMSSKLKLKRHMTTTLCLNTKTKNLTTQEQLDQQKHIEQVEQAMKQEEIESLN